MVGSVLRNRPFSTPRRRFGHWRVEWRTNIPTNTVTYSSRFSNLENRFMANRLVQETSPYLLQHAHNPVNWFPWGAEALDFSRKEEKPIFLSIGYSACHWCHVMEHESFESDTIAAVMNEHFICVKVDREERPDLDQIYMQAVQIMTGRGGWPMSVFLTPDLQPFYGGTYWPPTSRMGMPGFDQILHAVQDAWMNRRPQAVAQALELTSYLQHSELEPGDGEEVRPLNVDLLQGAGRQLQKAFDPRNGGFGSAPKFPHPMDLRVLLRVWRREGNESFRQMATHTLDKMADGGIYDLLGGGFHRYSVDERWLVPHFEKMLYDNALLASAYTEAFVATGNSEYARVTRETCDYVLRELTHPDGGFYSTEDADSEGHEGKFYVWSKDEIVEILGADAAEMFCYVFDVTDGGNFEGQNILNLPKSIEQCAKLHQLEADDLRRQFAEDKRKLLAVRNERVHPALDDKVLVNWNALMIDALAQAAGPLQEPKYAAAAARAADFILNKMRRPDGRLLHSWRNGKAKQDAFLDDYAGLVNAMVSVYEVTFDERYIDEAMQLAQMLLEHFADTKNGGFYFTANDHEELIARQKDWQDSSVPSGNSLAAMGLLRLGKLTGRGEFIDAAAKTLQAAAPLMERSPLATGQMLLALDFHLGPTPELMLLGDFASREMQAVLADLQRRYLSNKVVAARSTNATPANASANLVSLFAGKMAISPPPTLYVCENFACQSPVSGPAAIAEKLDTLSCGKSTWPR